MKFLTLLGAFLIATSAQNAEVTSTDSNVLTKDIKNGNLRRDAFGPEGASIKVAGEGLGSGQFNDRLNQKGPRQQQEGKGMEIRGGRRQPPRGPPRGFSGPPKIDESTLTAQQKLRYDELQTALTNWKAVYTPSQTFQKPQFRRDTPPHQELNVESA